MKKHNEIVYSTTDYSKFEKHPSNPQTRQPDSGLIESMKRLGWLSGCPAMVTPVDGKLRIIEGHRRYTAATRLNIPVKYVVLDVPNGINPREISSLVDPWDTKDCVQSEVQDGRTHYIKLKQFAEEHGIRFAAAALLLSDGKCYTHQLKAGTFRVTGTHFADAAMRIMKAIKGQDEPVRHKWWNGARLITALVYIFKFVKNFDPDRMVQKINSHRGRLDLQPNARYCVRMLEDIYNHFVHSEDKVSIYSEVDRGLAAEKQQRAQSLRAKRQSK